MERELEKDLKEIEYLIYVHKNRGNTNTQSVLERVYEIIAPCAKVARTLSELKKILNRDTIGDTKNEEDILKFYYCESEDDYYLGQRVQNMYYAKYGPGGFTWFMSRYLPWGTDGYPSEPKEIPFMEWIEGFISKHMNDGWIPVDERMPEEYGEYLVTIVPSAGYLWAKRIIANFSDLMGIVKKPIFYTGEVGKIDFEDITDMVIAWSPLPEPYRPERSRENEK